MFEKSTSILPPMATLSVGETGKVAHIPVCASHVREIVVRH